MKTALIAVAAPIGAATHERHVLQRAPADGHLDEVVADGRDGDGDAHPRQEQRIDAPVQPLSGHAPAARASTRGTSRRRCGPTAAAAAAPGRARPASVAPPRTPSTTAPAAMLATRNPPLNAKVDVSDVVIHSTAVPATPSTRQDPTDASEPAALAPLAPQREPDGDGRPDQQRLGPAVRAVVGARRVAVRGEERHAGWRRPTSRGTPPRRAPAGGGGAPIRGRRWPGRRRLEHQRTAAQTSTERCLPRPSPADEGNRARHARTTAPRARSRRDVPNFSTASTTSGHTR